MLKFMKYIKLFLHYKEPRERILEMNYLNIILILRFLLMKYSFMKIIYLIKSKILGIFYPEYFSLNIKII